MTSKPEPHSPASTHIAKGKCKIYSTYDIIDQLLIFKETKTQTEKNAILIAR